MAIAGSLLGADGFQPPVQLSLPQEKVADYHAGFNSFGVLTAAYVSGEALTLCTVTRDGVIRTPLGTATGPNLAFDSTGVVVAFSSPDPQDGGEHRIWTVPWHGGQLSGSEKLSVGPGDDTSPSLQLWGGLVPAAAWERRLAGGEPRVVYRRAGRSEIDLGPGSAPSLLLDGGDLAHVFFLREDDVVWVRETDPQRPGRFSEPLNLTRTPAAVESQPRAVIKGEDKLYVCFVRDSAIFLARNEGGTFEEPEQFAAAPASNPSLDVTPTEALALAFEGENDILFALGTTFYFPDARPVVSTAATESDPITLFDSFATSVLLFKRNDSLYYTTNAGSPRASFRAEPMSGEAPLLVAFHDESLGAVDAWDWQFGDGTTARDPNPTHLYSTSGEYSVLLRVSGPGGDSTNVHREIIRVLDPTNEMRLGNVRAFPGQKGIHVPVTLTHGDPAQGFTVAAVYDPSVISVREVVATETNVDWLEPELFNVQISENPAGPYIVALVLFDVAAPIEGKVLPPGKDQRVANIIVDVSRRAPPGTSTRIQLKNGIGRRLHSNIITVNGYTVMPVMGEGGLISLPHLSFPPPRFFKRGDTTGDGKLNISDGLVLLGYLFLGSEEPDCHDAADASDDGALDISDALFILEFLFLSGVCPPPPYPDPGFDPTDDELPPCMLR